MQNLNIFGWKFQHRLVLIFVYRLWVNIVFPTITLYFLLSVTNVIFPDKTKVSLCGAYSSFNSIDLCRCALFVSHFLPRVAFPIKIGINCPSLPGVIQILPLQGICNLQSLFLIFSPSPILLFLIAHSPFCSLPISPSPHHPFTPSL